MALGYVDLQASVGISALGTKDLSGSMTVTALNTLNLAASLNVLNVLVTTNTDTPTFSRGDRLGSDNLTISFEKSISYDLPGYGRPLSPYTVTCTVGRVHPTTGVFTRVGPEDRPVVKNKTGEYFANFIVGSNWTPGYYRIVWSYSVSQPDPAQTTSADFIVLAF